MNRIIRIIFSLSLLFSAIPSRAQDVSSETLMKYYFQEEGIALTLHNKVQLFFSGHDKFIDLFSYIDKAQDHVHLEYFNFRNDSIADATFDHLGNRIKDGVTVRAMFDAFGNSSNNQPLKKHHIKAIQDKGIDIVKFDPIRFPWVNHVLTRDHRKIVVIDGKVAYTGGMNIADYYIKGLEGIGAWHDIHMRIEGEAVRYLQDIFLKTWNKETHDQVSGGRYYPDLSALYGQKDGYDVEMAIVDRAKGKTSSSIRNAYAVAINSAQERVQILNPYFVPTHKVKKAIKDAVKRGVKVEIMIPDKSDIGFTPDAAKYVAHKLMKKGAEIYLFEGGFHHSKVMMVDDAFCTVGTANLNSRSLRYDYETNAFIFDEETTKELQDMFEEDKSTSKQMTRQYWKEEITPWKKFVGWFGNVLTPFL